MADSLVSVLVPAYSDQRFIEEVALRITEAPFRKEITVVDDGSADDTPTCHGRTFDEGKKITWRDGTKAITALVQLCFTPR
jgi:cellulose synthase/poly-beta-1,6-N-acetylglucosamine synthase-like glycosyltransferase